MKLLFDLARLALFLVTATLFMTYNAFCDWRDERKGATDGEAR